jgi:hypothetical protein
MDNIFVDSDKLDFQDSRHTIFFLKLQILTWMRFKQEFWLILRVCEPLQNSKVNLYTFIKIK